MGAGDERLEVIGEVDHLEFELTRNPEPLNVTGPTDVAAEIGRKTGRIFPPRQSSQILVWVGIAPEVALSVSLSPDRSIRLAAA
ncbi:hypothetical protein ES703_101716 [subsurface metagenome]